MARIAYGMVGLCALLLLPLQHAHAGLTPAQRIRAAQELVDVFAYRYGPLRYKEQRLHFSFAEIAESLLQSAAAADSDRALYQAMYRFTARFEDAHVRLRLPSSLRLSLGFEADAIGGEIVIISIDRDRLPWTTYPLEVGDRIVAIDRTPIAAWLREWGPNFATGSIDATQRAIAFYTISWRIERQGITMPAASIPARITVTSAADDLTRTLNIPWNVEGTPLVDMVTREPYEMMQWLGGARHVRTDVPFDMAPTDDPRQMRLSHDRSPSGTGDGWGSREPIFPLWPELVRRDRGPKQGDPLITGVIVTPHHRIGYLRIHSWDDEEDIDRKSLLAQLEREIPFLEAETDALILDQTGNPGGNICLMETVTGFFAGRPFATLTFQFKPTRERVAWFEDQARRATDAAEQELNGDIAAALRRAAEAGAELSDPIPLCRADGLIPPHIADQGQKNERPVVYSKPILLVIDELACSCGDFFPALLQDHGRATLFGRRTMGCGGSVIKYELTGYAGVSVKVTQSLALRPQPARTPDGTLSRYIENNGVTPDIPWDTTADDFRSGFPAYRQAILDAAIRLVAP